MKKLIVLIFLTGCVHIPEEIVIQEPVYLSPVPIHPVPPSPLNLTPPEFFVLTKDNVDTAFETESVFFSVNSDGYRILSENIQELRRYILDLQSTVKFYKKSIDYAEQEAARANNDSKHDDTEPR